MMDEHLPRRPSNFQSIPVQIIFFTRGDPRGMLWMRAARGAAGKEPHMLKALGEHLKFLAEDPGNNFASAIRRRAGPREAARYGQPLRRMVLAMPRMITQLREWGERPGLPARSRRMQGFALAYLYDPIDFLSASGPGLFRYLDDAYLIARIFESALEDRDFSRGASKDLTAAVPGWVELARRLLPAETAKIDALLDEVAAGPRWAARMKRKRRRGAP